AAGRPGLGRPTAGPRQIGRLTLDLFLELLEQREPIGRGAREAGKTLAALQGAHLVGVRLHHPLTDGDLTVPADGDLAVAANTENCRTMYDRKHAFLMPLDAPGDRPF